MSTRDETPSATEAADSLRLPYEAPTVCLLGSLTELTLGGVTAGMPDGFGQSGDEGSI